jgi:hypothetical protein
MPGRRTDAPFSVWTPAVETPIIDRDASPAAA